jgi:hypothetical protein
LLVTYHHPAWILFVLPLPYWFLLVKNWPILFEHHLPKLRKTIWDIGTHGFQQHDMQVFTILFIDFQPVRTFCAFVTNSAFLVELRKVKLYFKRVLIKVIDFAIDFNFSEFVSLNIVTYLSFVAQLNHDSFIEEIFNQKRIIIGSKLIVKVLVCSFIF